MTITAADFGATVRVAYPLRRLGAVRTVFITPHYVFKLPGNTQGLALVGGFLVTRPSDIGT
jgi:hypothetical protein